MPRFPLAVLVGLLLAGPSGAQESGHESEIPTAAPVSARLRVRDPGAKLGDDYELPLGLLVPPPGPDDWRFWVSADYAFAWIKGKNLPPLTTTSPPGTVQGAAGVLGIATTSVLIGGEPITRDLRSMGRLDFGMWFGPEKLFGVAAGGFVTDSKGASLGATSDGTTIIARPFTDATTGTPSSVLAAFPGISSGSVNVSAAMQTFCGANVDLRTNILSESRFRVESLVGYRYLRYGESLDMQQNLNPTGAFFPPGTQIVSRDSFQTVNNFHGCEAGFCTEIRGERWSFDVLTKLAAGNLRRETMINGGTLITVPGVGSAINAGGIYALSSNIGNHFNDSWVVAPELGLDVAYQVCPHVRLHLGYSLLYLQGIARAADQIDFTINPNLFPPALGSGPNHPAFNLVKSDIWIQSVNLGVEIRF